MLAPARRDSCSWRSGDPPPERLQLTGKMSRGARPPVRSGWRDRADRLTASRGTSDLGEGALRATCPWLHDCDEPPELDANNSAICESDGRP